MRRLIYRHEHIRDDFVIEPYLEVPLVYSITPFLEGHVSSIHMSMTESMNGYQMHRTLLEEEDDFLKMKQQEFRLDQVQSDHNLQLIQDAIGDLIPVKFYAYFVPDTSLLRTFIEMRGAENIFYDVIDQPEWVHEVLTFMKESSLHLLDTMEKELKAVNTGYDYVGSGGLGYTKELQTDGPLSYRNCWGFSDAQELSGVSPEMYEEFATAYHEPLLERFGLSCYGCCESMTDKLPMIKRRIRNLRRVSVNPWTDRTVAAKELEDRYILSWKPAPTQITQGFHEDFCRKDIEFTMEQAGDCVVEMILKDTITVQHNPLRIEKWVDIARGIAERGYR